MRRYETIFIVDPDVGDEGRSQLFDRTKSLIDAQQGLLVNFDEWGPRKLAYDIQKKARGYYVCMDYCGSSDLVSEIERTFRLDDRYLKYMTVLIDAQIDLEAIKAEIAEKEKAAQEAASSESEATVTEKTAAEREAEKETSPAAESPSQQQPEDETDRSAETTTPETDKEDE
jgi:small subunit ribosomal protein S6